MTFFACFLTIFLFLNTSVSAIIECLQGQRIWIDDVEISDTHVNKSCVDPTNVFVRINISETIKETASKIIDLLQYSHLT